MFDVFVWQSARGKIFLKFNKNKSIKEDGDRYMNVNRLFRNYAIAFFFAFILFSLLGRLIPPMQSPDEGYHIMRAYLLSRGDFMLESPPGKKSGGYVDQGLFNYQNLAKANLVLKKDSKITKARIDAMSSVKWAGKDIFVEMPTTGYYFPMIYAPQAIGLAVGELTGLSVQRSYFLARLFCLAVITALLFIAFRICPASSFIIGLIVLPMSLFQFLSTSIDGISLALALTCISIFIVGCKKRQIFPDWVSYLFIGALFILINSKIQLLSFMLMPFVIALIRRRLLYLWQGLVLTFASMMWLYVGIRFTNDGGMHHAGQSQFFVLEHYITHPWEFIYILASTLNLDGRVLFYRDSFIGILGWLDTSFSTQFYYLVSLLLVFLAITSISLVEIREDWLPRIALLIMSIASILTIFLALLVQWNPFPSQFIDGVQGRYFIIPLCAFAYVLNWSSGAKSRLAPIGNCLLLVLIALVATEMPKVLLGRYYIGS